MAKKATIARPSARAKAAPAPKPSPKAPPSRKTTSGPTNGKEDLVPLPDSIINALPTSKSLMQAIGDFTKATRAVKQQMSDIERRSDSLALARAYVVLHRIQARLAEAIKPFTELVAEYKQFKIPEAFERDHITQHNLAEGFRVGVSSTFRASIRPDYKAEAYEWLMNNDLEDLITQTVNSSTLSATAKQLLEEKGKELPEKLFNVALVPNTSVTAK